MTRSRHAASFDSSGDALCEYLTPPQIAKLLGINPDKVRKWIMSGEMRAANVSDSDQRPRWRVHRDDFRECLAKRANRPTSVVRRRPRLSAIKQFV